MRGACYHFGMGIPFVLKMQCTTSRVDSNRVIISVSASTSTASAPITGSTVERYSTNKNEFQYRHIKSSINKKLNSGTEKHATKIQKCKYYQVQISDVDLKTPQSAVTLP